MTWGAFSARGTAALVSVKGSMDSQAYVKVLEKSLIPFAADNHPRGWTFQQDNAAIHTSALTKEWFFNESIMLMDWPPVSPDLNPIENLWGNAC